MDITTMEEILRLLISGTEAIGEALQIALLQYQDRAEEERCANYERSCKNGKQ